MSEFVLIPNPAYAGRKPRIMEAACHDRTPFITIECQCGEQMHLHESQTARVPADAEICTGCKRCGNPLVFPSGYFARAFAQLRAEGWLA